MSSFFEYPPYVSAAERKKQNAKAAAKLAKKYSGLAPVVVEGSKIAQTFWGKSWCKNIESYEDYAFRLGRGRSYVRQGAVLDLKIHSGEITALVAGSSSEPYKIEILISPLAADRWEALKQKCTGKIDSLFALIQGKLSPEILATFCDHDAGLFPAPEEIDLDCSCPDYADCCKHVAAALYGVGARLDKNPELFFLLRGIEQSELLNSGTVDLLTEGTAPTLAPDALTDIFGVQFDELPEAKPAQRNATIPGCATATRECSEGKVLPAAKKTPVKSPAPKIPPPRAKIPAEPRRVVHVLTPSGLLRINLQAALETAARPKAKRAAETAVKSPALILELFELLGMNKKSPAPFLRDIAITPELLKTWKTGVAKPGPVSLRKITNYIFLRAKKQIADKSPQKRNS